MLKEILEEFNDLYESGCGADTHQLTILAQAIELLTRFNRDDFVASDEFNNYLNFVARPEFDVSYRELPEIGSDYAISQSLNNIFFLELYLSNPHEDQTMLGAEAEAELSTSYHYLVLRIVRGLIEMLESSDTDSIDFLISYYLSYYNQALVAYRDLRAEEAGLDDSVSVTIAGEPDREDSILDESGDTPTAGAGAAPEGFEEEDPRLTQTNDDGGSVCTEESSTTFDPYVDCDVYHEAPSLPHLEVLVGANSVL